MVHALAFTNTFFDISKIEWIFMKLRYCCQQRFEFGRHLVWLKDAFVALNDPLDDSDQKIVAVNSLCEGQIMATPLQHVSSRIIAGRLCRLHRRMFSCSHTKVYCSIYAICKYCLHWNPCLREIWTACKHFHGISI